MTFIKVGNRYINLDQVTDIHDLGENGIELTMTALVETAAGYEANTTIATSKTAGFYGAYATALRFWLDQRSADILRHYEMETKMGPR